MRYFRTPFTTSKFDSSKMNLCWRDCKQIGDHTQNLWDCPKLKSYWEGIQTEIFIILKIKLPLDLLFYITGAIPVAAIEKRKLYLLRIFLLMARKILTTVYIMAQTVTTHYTSMA